MHKEMADMARSFHYLSVGLSCTNYPAKKKRDMKYSMREWLWSHCGASLFRSLEGIRGDILYNEPNIWVSKSLQSNHEYETSREVTIQYSRWGLHYWFYHPLRNCNYLGDVGQPISAIGYTNLHACRTSENGTIFVPWSSCVSNSYCPSSTSTSSSANVIQLKKISNRKKFFGQFTIQAVEQVRNFCQWNKRKITCTHPRRFDVAAEDFLRSNLLRNFEGKMVSKDFFLESYCKNNVSNGHLHPCDCRG